MTWLIPQHTEDEKWLSTNTASPTQPLLNKVGKSDCIEDLSHSDASSLLCKINKKAILISFMKYPGTLQVSSQALQYFLDSQGLIKLLLCLLQKDFY